MSNNNGTLIRELLRRSLLTGRRRIVLGASGVPDLPQNVVATKGSTTASVAFTAPLSDGGSAITGYVVTSNPGNLTGSGAASPIVVTGLTNGTSYTFRVHAVNANGNGAQSTPSNAVVPSTVPGAPTIGAASNAAIGSVSVAFTPPASNGGEAITTYTATSNPGSITAQAASSPIVVTGLTSGQAYTFTVKATNLNGDSAASAASNSVTAVGAPDAPTIGTATPGNGSVSVAFTPPGNNGGSAITTYTAYGSNSTVTNGASSPIIVPCANGVTVEFYVTASNQYGESLPSDSTGLVLPAGQPDAPTIIGVQRGNASVQISYDVPASNGAAITGYTATSTPGGIQGSGTSNPLTVSGLTNGTAYTFVMYATNAAGNSANSNTSASVTPATVPSAPTIGTAVARDAAADVAFTANSDGGSAIISYTATASPGGATATGTASPIAVFGLQNGVAHTFTVKARNAIGDSAASAASNSVTPAQSTTVPGSPTIGTAARSASQACTVAFTPPANNGGSAITGYTATSTPGGLTGTGSSSPITVSGLTNGTSYTFSVYATNSNGNSLPSAQSNVAIPATVPGAPGTPTAVAGNAQVSLSFTAPASNGGSAITSYTGTSSPGGIQRTMTAAELAVGPMVITGLSNGTAYTFTVVAANQYGSGAASAASNSATPAAGGAAGPFDSLYAASWAPVSDTTVHTPNALSIPAKSTGISSVSYTDGDYGTKIFRIAASADSPGNPASGKMRHEYSRRCPWNCNQTKYILQNNSGFFFVYDADTFARLEGGVTTVDAKQYAVGTNATHPKDPRDWTWHPTDPNKIIFFPQTDGLILYEFDVVTKVLTTKANFTGRLGVFGTVTKLAMSEGRPSDDARYWGWQVFNGSATVGYMTWDMQTDTITGTLVTTDAANNTTMSSSGNYIIISAGGAGLTYAQCAASPNIRGTRAYTRNFSSFKQVHVTTTHADPGYDYLGNEVYVSLNPGGSTWTAIATNSLFYITLNNSDGPVQLIALAPAMSQWNSHYSGCCAPGRPGWAVFSAYDSTNRTGFPRYLDNNIALVELKPNPVVYRLADHRTVRLTYWQEPHATISRDGLRVMYSCAWDNTLSTDAPLAYMIGLPSWIYGAAPPVGNNKVTNGTFVGLTNWTVTAGGWVATGGTALYASGAGASTLQQNVGALIAGRNYRITFELSGYTGPGDMAVRLIGGATTVASANINGNGPKTVDLVAASGNDTLGFHAFSTFNGSIDNVVMVEQAVNLLGNGTFDNSTGWSIASGCSVTGGVLLCQNTAANVTNTYAMSAPAGTFRVTFDIPTHVTGNITMRFNSGAFVGTTYSGTETGTFTNDIVCTAAVTVFEVRVTRDGSSMDCSVDNIFIEKIA